MEPNGFQVIDVPGDRGEVVIVADAAHLAALTEGFGFGAGALQDLYDTEEGRPFNNDHAMAVARGLGVDLQHSWSLGS